MEPITFSADPCRIETLGTEEKVRFYAYLAELSRIISTPGEAAKYFDAWCAMRGEWILDAIRQLTASLAR